MIKERGDKFYVAYCKKKKCISKHRDCVCTIRYAFTNGIWCYGIVKKKKAETNVGAYPFDVIRHCDMEERGSKLFVKCVEMAPDEALIMSECFSKSVRLWMSDQFKPYSEFRSRNKNRKPRKK